MNEYLQRFEKSPPNGRLMNAESLNKGPRSFLIVFAAMILPVLATQ